MFDLSRSEHQDFLCCFQNLHNFFKTSQDVRKASKTDIGLGFPGAVLFNDTYFCYIWTEIFVQVCMLGISPSLVSRYCEGYSLKFQKARTKIEAKLRQLAGQTQDNFNFGRSLLKF